MIEQLTKLTEDVAELKTMLRHLLDREATKEWYSTEEVATILGKDGFTVREWCRLGRIHAEKRRSGRGRYKAWAIAHAELLRIQKEGLLPAKHGADR